MCNVHFIKPMDGRLTSYDVSQMVNMLDSASASNPHGFGMFTDGGKTLKKAGTFSALQHGSLLKSAEGDKFIVGHNRYTTHGINNDENSHPFENERFIWVHNGILSNHAELGKQHGLAEMQVDSQIIGELALKFVKSKEQRGDKIKIVKIIKRVAHMIVGDYSVFIYDKVSKRLFYFRDGREFVFKLIRNRETKKVILVGSSRKENIGQTYNKRTKKLFGFEMRNWEVIGNMTPEEDKIYEVTDKGLVLRGHFTAQPNYVWTAPNPVEIIEEKQVPIKAGLWEEPDGDESFWERVGSKSRWLY